MEDKTNLEDIASLLQSLSTWDYQHEKDVSQLKNAVDTLKLQQMKMRNELPEAKAERKEHLKIALEKVQMWLDRLKESLSLAEIGKPQAPNRIPPPVPHPERQYNPLPFRPSIQPAKQTQTFNNNAGPPEIADHEIVFEESAFIGKGSYGNVYRGMCRGKRVAIKVPKEQLPPRKLEQFRQEVDIMSKIFHPNIVLFMGANTQSDRIKIVTELCVTDVEKILRSDKPLTMYERMQMAKGAALGMNWLHGIVNIIHRDLKSANLLVAEDGTVKVTDFGFGEIFEAGTSFKGTAKGTPLWMAPEVMLGKETNEKRDVYSFGIILWEFISRKEPFSQFKDWSTFKKAVAIQGVRPPIPSDTLPSLRHLIQNCWHPDYKKRPSFEEIIFRLNEVLVDCAISDPPANMFWKQNFLLYKQDLEDLVPWSEFGTTLARCIGWDRGQISRDLDLEQLRPFLCFVEEQDAKKTIHTKTTDSVSLDHFDKVVQWFGPFFLPEIAADVLRTIHRLNQSSWFHGFISKEEALRRLETRPLGTYLLRLSTTSPGRPYTLSVITQTDISHRRIAHNKHGDPFVINISSQDYQFPSLFSLIEGCRGLLKLANPCPKTPARASNYL
eukprot:TRINITY_DN3303_c0_g1_i1.p1 TRINITY_DN3303_c0_g1~~TRINITY_DN3303_c0_g1_i1.p1  ORF type:complete len:610 (-),score=109.22 TRINITY_DN3303_c0_g1_i1:80-1909(-)